VLLFNCIHCSQVTKIVSKCVISYVQLNCHFGLENLVLMMHFVLIAIFFGLSHKDVFLMFNQFLFLPSATIQQ